MRGCNTFSLIEICIRRLDLPLQVRTATVASGLLTTRATSAERTARGPSPSVRPTIVFLAAFAAAWGVHALAPLRMIAGGSPTLAILGIVLAILGLLLFAWSLLLFGRARTGIMYHQPAICLMMRGPY